MKTIKLLAVLLLAVSLTNTAFAGSQNVDTAKSSVKWLAKKVTGQHSGTIAVKEGTLVVEKGKITGGKVVIDMNTVVDEDIKDTDMAGKLVGHLKSDDFFAVATFPTSDLVLTKVESNGNDLAISGNLTIKGIMNPVNFKATSANDGKTTTYKGTLVVDRSKYNVRYGSKSFFDNLGDKVIADEFTLDFSLVVNE